MIKICKPKIIHNQSTVIYNAKIKNEIDENELWYKLPCEFESLVSDSSDAALVALLIPAMTAGEDIFVEGWISEKLYHNLSYRYQKILQTVIPFLKIIKINVKELRSIDYKAQGVATGFSAGVDSYCTLKDYFFDEIPPSLKITHLTYHNVGSHGNTEKGRKLFHQRYAQLDKIVKKWEIPFIMIDSNLDTFYRDRRLYFMQTHTPRNMSVALLLQKGIKTFLYSSALSYNEIQVKPAYNIDICDSVTLPILSTESIEFLSVGSEYSRVKKTLNISNIEDTYSSLDVCVDSEDGKNCSICFKCMRTQLTLDIAGKLSLYNHVFDNKKYEKHKKAYIRNILKSDFSLDIELVNFAKETNYPLPFFAMKYGEIIKSLKTIKKFLKTAR